MKALVVSMKYDYGDPNRGLSFMEYYFEKPISQITDQVLSYDYMSEIHRIGKQQMNEELLALIQRERPDVTIFSPFTDQFIPELIDKINNFTITIGYYFDDPWRIEYSAFWAKHFTFVTTSDINGLRKWKERGYSNFIYSPFGCSLDIFRRKDYAKRYDVSFVGQYHPYRAWYIQQLRKAEIKVHVWGFGWPAGRVDIETMVDMFNYSKINLNMSNNDSWDLRYILSLHRPIKENLLVAKKTIHSLLKNDVKIYEMVKARHFEINACGGFQLTFYVEGLESHYRIGKEIAIYQSVDELIDKIRYYLKYQEERESIAQKGYKRTVQEHDLRYRFINIFKKIGLGKCLKS